MLSDPVAVEGRDTAEVAPAGAAEVERPGCGHGRICIHTSLFGESSQLVRRRVFRCFGVEPRESGVALLLASCWATGEGALRSCPRLERAAGILTVTTRS